MEREKKRARQRSNFIEAIYPLGNKLLNSLFITPSFSQNKKYVNLCNERNQCFILSRTEKPAQWGGEGLKELLLLKLFDHFQINISM